ncbi:MULTISPECIES: amidohydrolase [Caulobacter]|jgi:amidohydrolase|uniref:Amidohydrolase n=1 Tax=Caulobacter vibrioides OR37 TaxID=1292034 RepID=R0EHH6_CAUVI|nr:MULTISPECIES: amidohydrolase [Caulobacter]ENZ80667.1 amidohydrolase [Caulobacter vibrioides OR37]MBQ1560872.1 amidohydrolase [Caulobacter sp.]
MKKTLIVTAALAALATSALGAPLNVLATKTAIDAQLDHDYPALDALYKDIHSHPELGFQEVETAKKLAAQMRALGFTVTEGVGKTGVVAVLKNGDGPKVLIRTELDALPMQEKTGLPYASTATAMWNGEKVFVDHSCGHDIHMAAWIGTARQMVARKAQWKGTLVFVAQPSEETVSGAKAMLADGFIDRFGKPDYGFALHVGPGAAGEVYYKPGVLTSTSDALDVTFNGRGAHGSMPAASIDPVMMAARFTVDVQSVISREKDPAAFGVVTVGSIQAGSAGNIIPDKAKVRGTIRTQDAAVRDKILAGVERTVKGVTEMAGAPPADLTITPGGKAVINDQALTDRTAAVFKTAFGARAVLTPQPGSASEDYSEFIIAGVPSVYFSIGGYDPAVIAKAKAEGKVLPVNHSPYFAPVPEPSIRTGVEAMTLAVMNVMAK